MSELNVENETFVTVNKILDKESIEKEILEAERKWSELYKKLCNSIGNLTEINVPNTVETIQGEVFEACPVQAVLNISENVRKLRNAM